jgi:hypothetical protein
MSMAMAAALKSTAVATPRVEAESAEASSTVMALGLLRVSLDGDVHADLSLWRTAFTSAKMGKKLRMSTCTTEMFR